MREVRTEIEIAATDDTVWGLLTNIENWTAWNPTINASSGTAAPGATLSITMRGQGGKNGPKYAPVVTILEAPRQFRWRANMMGGLLFRNDKILELQPSATGTRLVHTETFGGLMVPMFGAKLKTGVPPILNAFNAAVKQRAEAG